ncbi:MAG: hypothetical protein RL612_709 [Actinomycetota bacterium]|jgi:hypothetical protein
MLKWWAIGTSVLGGALSWFGSIPGATNLTSIYLGTVLVFVALVLWLAVFFRWLFKKIR